MNTCSVEERLWPSAFAVFMVMREHGLPVPADAGAQLVRVCLKTGALEEAVQVFDALQVALTSGVPRAPRVARSAKMAARVVLSEPPLPLILSNLSDLPPPCESSFHASTLPTGARERARRGAHLRVGRQLCHRNARAACARRGAPAWAARQGRAADSRRV